MGSWQLVFIEEEQRLNGNNMNRFVSSCLTIIVLLFCVKLFRFMDLL